MPTSTSPSPSTPLQPPRKSRFLSPNTPTSSGKSWTRSLSNLRKEAVAQGGVASAGREGGKGRALTTDDVGRVVESAGSLSAIPNKSSLSTSTSGTTPRTSAPAPTPAPAPAKGLRAFFQSFKRSHSTPAPTRSTTALGAAKPVLSVSTAGVRSSDNGSAEQKAGGGLITPVLPVSSPVMETAQTTPEPIQGDDDNHDPIDPANIPLPASPILPFLGARPATPTTPSPTDPTVELLHENTLGRAPTTESIRTEPSLSNTDETIEQGGLAGSKIMGVGLGMEEVVVTPVTSLEGGQEEEERLRVVGVVDADAGADGGRSDDERAEEEDEFEMGERARVGDVKPVGGGGVVEQPDSGDITPTPNSPPVLATTTTLNPINPTRPTIDTSTSTLSRTTSPTSPPPPQLQLNSIPVPIPAPTRGSYVRSSSTGSNGNGNGSGQTSRSPPVANSARYQSSSQQQQQQPYYPQGQPGTSPNQYQPHGRSQGQSPGSGGGGGGGGFSPGGLVRSASSRLRSSNSFGGGGGNNKSYGPTSPSNQYNPHAHPRQYPQQPRRNTHRMSVSPTMYTMGGVFVEAEEIMDKDEKRLTEAMFCS